MHILLIDDEGPLVDALALRLRTVAHHTTSVIYEVEDEASLIQQLQELKPEAVILDFGMDQEGDQLYRWIKKERKDVKIAFWTCYADSAELRKLMLAAGAADREIVKKNSVGNDMPQLLMVLQ